MRVREIVMGKWEVIVILGNYLLEGRGEIYSF